MEKVSYKIDIVKYLVDLAIRENPGVDPEKIKKTIGSGDEWKVVYSLFGVRGSFPNRYTLTDYDGNRIDITTINNFQHSILGDCFNNFWNPKKFPDPLGAIEITAEEFSG